eukprot:TRINITY_DN69042_c0_g1_i1.p1 TRINITY_DN69042_c0_g1~~TRINITY_DN69042_c0_g1_i1.p1  ORF type:complete len:421 (+),score=95.46 TRINITY_DN69042_c0_g1_i1:147-1409(+)
MDSPSPTLAQLEAAADAVLSGRDLASLSLKALRREIETHLSLPAGALDGRKDELRTLAQARVNAQAEAAAAAVAPVAPPVTAAPVPAEMVAEAAEANGIGLGKKRKSLLMSGGAETSAAVSTPEQADGPKLSLAEKAAQLIAKRAKPAAPKATLSATGVTSVDGAPAIAKPKAAPSAWMIFSSDNRNRIQAELAAKSGAKPSFGEVAAALSSAWKQMPTDEKDVYEQKAIAGKAAMPVVAAPASSASGGRGGRGRGRGGRGRGRGGSGGSAEVEGPPLTRAEFLTAAKQLQCVIRQRPDEDGTASSAEGTMPESVFDMPPRLFKTGSGGWFFGAKVRLPVGDKTVCVQGCLNLTIIGSKSWADGEGLAELVKKTGTVEGATEGDEDAETGVEAPSKDVVTLDVDMVEDDEVEEVCAVAGA